MVVEAEGRCDVRAAEEMKSKKRTRKKKLFRSKQAILLMRRKKTMESSPTTVDRISNLPDEIIFLILASLDSHESAARTCILSRRWLHIWRSYPAVDFQDDTINFHRFVIATTKRLRLGLLHQRAVPLLLDSFSIKLPFLEYTYEDTDLDQLLSLAIDGGRDDGSRSPLKVVVKNIDLSFFIKGATFSNCCRTKFLHLRGCDLSGWRHNFNNRLDNLQEVTLNHVRLSRESFPGCLADAPRLEKLSLSIIYGIDALHISASDFPSLKFLSFVGPLDPVRQLGSPPPPPVQTGDNLCMVLTVAPDVKLIKLELLGQFKRSELEDIISKIPSLESFEFSLPRRCILGEVGLRISARILRKLTYSHQFEDGAKFEIDAPNLVDLCIRIIGLPIMNVIKVAPNCRCLVDCYICEDSLTTDWFIELRKCLATLATQIHHLVFQLEFWERMKESMFDLNLVGCESSPLAVQHLQVATDLALGVSHIEKQVHQTLLDGLLWTCHPKKTLSVARLSDSPHDRSLFSYISEQIESKNLLQCCNNGMCWRHQFKDTKITSLTVDDLSTIDKSMVPEPSISMLFLLPQLSDDVGM